jgi:hypothetical protein
VSAIGDFLVFSAHYATAELLSDDSIFDILKVRQSTIAASQRVYQLDLVTPGIWPANASRRKQMRQRPNFLM